MTNFTEQVLPSSQYLVKIMDANVDDAGNAIYKYEIAVGPYAGFGASKFKNTGGYPLCNRFALPRAEKALFVFLCTTGVVSTDGGVNLADRDVLAGLMSQTVGKLVSVQVESQGNYYSIKRHDPAKSYQIRPDEIRVGTSSWAAGTPDVQHAVALANYSGLPSLMMDVRERNSPMVDWCAEHKIIPLPMYFPAGDYSAPGSSVIVDRKANILELYSDFATPGKYGSYCTAAQISAAAKKQLVYVVGIDQQDGYITSVSDLASWHYSVPGKTIKPLDGAAAARNLGLYLEHFRNVTVKFVPKDDLCETIYDLVTGRSK